MIMNGKNDNNNDNNIINKHNKVNINDRTTRKRTIRTTTAGLSPSYLLCKQKRKQ